MAYAWHSFIERPVVGASALTTIRIGNTIFTLGAVALIAIGARHTAAFTRTADARTPDAREESASLREPQSL